MNRADRIEAAARALLADIESQDGNLMALCACEACSHDVLAMVSEGDGEPAYCDACSPCGTDLSYAPAVRALRAALAEVPS